MYFFDLFGFFFLGGGGGQYIVCFSFVTMHTRYATIMCLQNRLAKKTFTKHQRVTNWTDAKTSEVKKLRKHSKFTVRCNKFLPKKVEEDLDSTSSSSKPISSIRFPPFSQVKAAGNQALVYYGEHLVTLSLPSNTGPFCNFWVLFLISSCWEKSQSFLFVKLLVTKSRSNTCFQGDLETCDLTWSPFM